MGSMAESIHELYGELWGREDPEFEAELSASLRPRSAEVLFARFGELGVRPDDVVLDIGCRDAKYAVELARRFGCRAVAVDPVALHVELARALVAEAGLADRVA